MRWLRNNNQIFFFNWGRDWKLELRKTFLREKNIIIYYNQSIIWETHLINRRVEEINRVYNFKKPSSDI